jgi:hypothetical protein
VTRALTAEPTALAMTSSSCWLPRAMADVGVNASARTCTSARAAPGIPWRSRSGAASPGCPDRRAHSQQFAARGRRQRRQRRKRAGSRLTHLQLSADAEKPTPGTESAGGVARAAAARLRLPARAAPGAEPERLRGKNASAPPARRCAYRISRVAPQAQARQGATRSGRAAHGGGRARGAGGRRGAVKTASPPGLWP